MWLCILLGALMGRVSGALSGPIGWRLPGETPRFERAGDVVIGGSFSILFFYNVTLFDFTFPPAGLPPSGVSPWGYRVAQSFVFAVEEINRSPKLLPNLTLGFSIRNSGDSVRGALRETMGFLTGQEEPLPNYSCHLGPPRAAMVGDTRSALSVSMARLLGLYKFPQVSYSSTLPSLSDKTQFPSFLRTLASDLTSSHALTQLVLHFQWSWVGILSQDDDFGQQASSLISQELSQAGVCIEFHLQVPSQESSEKTEAIVQKMLRCTAKVVLVFLSNSNFQLILYRLRDLRVAGQVWVSKGALHMALALTIPGVSQVLQGSFGLLYHSSQARGFPEYLAQLRPSRTPEDMFMESFWESTFGCTWPHRNSTVTGGVKFCSGNESLREREFPFQEVSKIDAAYTAVHSIAHALQDLIACERGDGACADPQRFQPWQINRSPQLLPNLTLGFSIRNSGDSVRGALRGTMGFLMGQEEPVPNYTCHPGPPRAAMVGDTRSALSVSMARLLGLYKFPQEGDTPGPVSYHFHHPYPK
uniref:vomeronasal type-2 receptor 1-like n=1 Tax=Jaculus jaculus TaxID=51337 RepID=UPI001E1B1524|nr:vomeronasal type-2 receptor 1-like [Jaculus jaculus]